MLEWEYQPAAFASRFWVAFGGTTADDGYRLSFGGAVEDPQEGRIPAGVIRLAKGAAGAVILQAPHSVDYRANYRHGWSGNTRKIPFDHPIPGFWTRFRLQRSGRFLRLEMTNVSIFPDGRARGGTATIKTADVPTGMTPVLLWEDTGEVEGPVPLGSVLELGFAGQGACRQLRLE